MDPEWIPNGSQTEIKYLKKGKNKKEKKTKTKS